jgi:hypothetical protein
MPHPQKVNDRDDTEEPGDDSYPDAALMIYVTIGTFVGFVAALVCKVVSLAVVAVPSVLCSVLLIMALKMITPVRRTSVTTQAILCAALTPVSHINSTISLFPIVSIAFTLAYLPAETESPRYSPAGYATLLFFAVAASAFAALACVLCHTARPSPISADVTLQ